MDAQRELTSGNVPVMYQGKYLEAEKPTSAQKAAWELAAEYVSDWEATVSKGRCIALLGPAQVGKTMLAAIILNERLRQHRALDRSAQIRAARKMVSHINTREPFCEGYPGYFVPVYHYLSHQQRLIKLNQRPWEDAGLEIEQHEKLLEGIQKRVQLLVVDDIGKEHVTGTRYAEDEIDNLLRTRWHFGLPTIVTSNLLLEDWESYNVAMRAFVETQYEVLTIGGDGTRRSRR